MHTLLVLGASGVMGRRLVRLAQRLLPNVRVLQGSRRAQPPVDVHDPASLHGALAGVDAVINAVGPFEYDPAPLLHACAAKGCHYVDIAETPAFLERVAEVARELPAGPRPSAVVTGCSTVPGLVQVLAQAWSGRADVQQVRVFLSMGSGNPISPTLLYCLLQPLGAQAPDGTRYFGRLLGKRPPGLQPRLCGRYPSSFDRHGLPLGDRVVPATFHAGLDRQSLSYLMWWAGRVVPLLTPFQLKLLCRLAQPLVGIVRALGTTIGVLSIEGQDDQGHGTAEIEVRAEQAGLDVAALPAVWAVRRLLTAAPLPRTGLLRLEALFTPREVGAWLHEEGYRLRQQ